LETLESRNIDHRPLLKEAGIDQAKLSNPIARIRVDRMNTLWNLAKEATGDECLGMTSAVNIRPTTIHALGFALMVSNSLYDAFERLHRFYRIISDTIELKLETIDNMFVVNVNYNESEPSPVKESIDMALAAITHFARTLMNEDIKPLSVEFNRAKPQNPNKYTQVFQCPVVFEQATNRLVFRLDDILRTLPLANAEIARCNDDIVIKYLAGFEGEKISDRVQKKMIELLPLGEPSMKKLAEALGIGTKSLHRSLKKEEVSYRSILENLRKHLAIEYLKKPEHSIIEIAFQLGYSDSGNFTRAFKRWYKISPSRFREGVKS